MRVTVLSTPFLFLKFPDIFMFKDDSLREMMQSFLLSTASQQEIAALDSKVLVDCIFH